MTSPDEKSIAGRAPHYVAEERRPNWLASTAAGAGVLGVGVLLQIALARTGFPLDEGIGSRVLSVAFVLAFVVGFNLSSMRLARTSWGSAGQHEPQPGRASSFLLIVSATLAAGLSGYVIALFVLLGFGWMDSDNAWLYPSAVMAALAGSCVAAALLRRSPTG